MSNYHVEVSPDIKQSTHHVALTDGKKWLGLIISDSKGAADPFNFSASPNQRSSLRTKSGSTKYEDLEEPWTATAQDDWSGGRALEDYEDDTTRFYDSRRCQTAWTQIYNAPLDYYATGLKDEKTNWPGSVDWKTIYAGTSYAFNLQNCSMTAGEIYILLRRRGTPKHGLTVSLCETGDGTPGTVLAEHTYTTDEITDVLSEWKKFTFDEITLNGNYWIKVTSESGDTNNYWEIGIKHDQDAMYTFYCDGSVWSQASAYDIYYRIAAGDTGRSARFFMYKQLTFAIWQKPTGEAPKLFINGEIGQADSNAGNTNKVIDTAKSWSLDQWKGCKVGIIAGKGIAEHRSVWRTITSNDTTSLTVDEPWTIEHDETTVYIITDTERFYEIPQETHGLTGFVSDILITNDIIYFAQGDEIPVRKLRWKNGSWSSIDDQYAYTVNGEETTVNNCAMYLQTVRSEDGLVIWRGQNNDGNHQVSISQTAVTDWLEADIVVADYTTKLDSSNDDIYTDAVDFTKADDTAIMYKCTAGELGGTGSTKVTLTIQGSDNNVTFEDISSFTVDASNAVLFLGASSKKRFRRIHAKLSGGTSTTLSSFKIETVNHSRYIGTLTFNDSYGKITSLQEYKSMSNTSYNTLWINREGMIHSISYDNTVDKINLEEMSTVMEEWNGRTSMIHNVYYYVRWQQGGIQRYYNQQLDAVGPDRDTGLPEDRQGAIADMFAYPGRYFAAVDGGEENYSSVLMNNNSGWHEIYRAPNAGERITALGYQTISGERPDRLWIAVGDDIVWLVMPSNTLKAYYDTSAEYTHESVLVSSWMSIGMVDVIKQWGSLNIMAENLDEDTVFIEADYQIDQDPTWYPMAETYVTSPEQEVHFDGEFGVSAKRLRYRLRLQTKDKSKTPFVKTTVMKTVIRVSTKYCYTLSCRNIEKDVNLRGEKEDITPWDRAKILIDWADNATALRMYSFTELINDKRVFVDPITFSNIKEVDHPGFITQVTLNEI